MNEEDRIKTIEGNTKMIELYQKLYDVSDNGYYLTYIKKWKENIERLKKV